MKDNVPLIVDSARHAQLSSLGAIKVSDKIEDRSVWDVDLAQRVLGKVVLVGLTYVDADGAVSEHQQFFGTAVSVHQRNGVLLSLSGLRSGESFNLSPDTRGIDAAEPGEYRLRAAGDVVVNPDYTAVFLVTTPRGGAAQ